MFKKNVWIVGLFAALAIMFVGCLEPEADTSGDLQETVVFDLETDEGIQALKVGRLTFTDADNPIAPLVKAGEIPGHISRFEAVAGPNGISLKYISVASWGPGVDFNNSVFNFREGDVIKVAGKILSGSGKVQLNCKVGAENAIASFDGTGAFSLEATLTAAQVGDIKGGNPSAIRFEARTGGLEIQIDTINIKGMRSASETPDPEPEYDITGAGKYLPPASSGNDIYIDLNEALIGSALTPATNLPYAYITADNLIVNFDTDRQTIFIPFTDEVKDKIVAAAKNAFTFDVTIIGIQGGWLRWCIGADRGASWNMTNMIGGSATSTFNAVQVLKAGDGGSNYIPDDMNGIVMQVRPTNDGAALATPFKMVIGSIKVTPKPPTKAVDAADIKIAPPTAGIKAPASVDITIPAPTPANPSATAVAAKGAITWSPALPPNGAFAVLTTYSATIVVTPNPDYYFTNMADITVSDGTQDIGGLYLSGTVYTGDFDETGATLALLKDGELWKLSDWLTTNTTMGWPLQNANGSTVTTGGITVTNATASWHGFDIMLDKIDEQVNPAVYKIKVVVTGKVTALTTTGTKGKMKLGGAESPYNEIIVSGELDTNDTFTLTSEIPADFITNGNQRVRIQNGLNVNIKDFIVTEIVVSNEGAR
jgi:hypothetical protein